MQIQMHLFFSRPNLPFWCLFNLLRQGPIWKMLWKQKGSEKFLKKNIFPHKENFDRGGLDSLWYILPERIKLKKFQWKTENFLLFLCWIHLWQRTCWTLIPYVKWKQKYVPSEKTNKTEKDLVIATLIFHKNMPGSRLANLVK